MLLTHFVVILATHAAHRLGYADHIIALGPDGRLLEQGSYQQLKSNAGYVDSLAVNAKDDLAEVPANVPQESPTTVNPNTSLGSEDIASSPSRTTGDWRTYRTYFSASGILSSILCVIWTTTFLLSAYAPGVLIKFFTSATPSHSTNNLFLAILGLLAAVSSITLGLCAWQVFLDMIPRGSRNLHLNLLTVVQNAPLSFFTKTDSGDILNRFSNDMSLVDADLPSDFLETLFGLIAGIITGALISSTATFFLATVPVTLAVLYAIQIFYLRSSRQLRLLDLQFNAPLQTHFSETISGLCTIRAFGWKKSFENQHLERLDQSQKPFYLLMCIQRWLAVVLDIIVAFLATILMVIVVAKRESINPALVGIGLLNVTAFNGRLTGGLS